MWEKCLSGHSCASVPLLDHLLEILQILCIDITLSKSSRVCLPRSRLFKGVGACINRVFTVSCESAIASLLLPAIWVGKRPLHYLWESASWGGGGRVAGSLTLAKCISVTMKNETSLQKALCQDSFHLIHEEQHNVILILYYEAQTNCGI